MSLPFRGLIQLLCGVILVALAASCHMHPDAKQPHDKVAEDNVYTLHLNPVAGSRYYFDITNEAGTKMEVDDKKTDNLNRATVGVYYQVDKDSAGNFLLHMKYDKVKMYIKNNDVESEYDAANARVSIEPMERLLGILKTADISATLNPSGEVRSVSGYKDLVDKFIASMSATDSYGRTTIRNRWNQLIEDGMVRKNMEQLFKIFPDSAVHIGDTWTLNSRQKTDLSMNVKNIFKLKSIDDGMATITSEGDIKSDNTPGNLMGYDVTSNLTGNSTGKYKVDVISGMLLSCQVDANIKGSIQLLGKEIPITIKMNTTVKGRRDN